MAQGITIDEVTNILDSTNIDGTEKIPVSSGETDPQVVTTGELKEYINDGVQGEISDLDTIRSGAAAGATAYQKPGTGIPSTDLSSDVQTSLGKANTALQSFTEEDPTVPSWAKSSSKPSYTASEVGAVPTTRTVNGKALSENISLTASDVGALPSDTPLFSGDYDDLTDKPQHLVKCVNGSSYGIIPSGGGYVCTTSADATTKIVDAIGYILAEGVQCNIRMINNNVANNVTLNINSTGEKALYYNNAQASSSNSWNAGDILEVYYDGTQYKCVTISSSIEISSNDNYDFAIADSNGYRIVEFTEGHIKTKKFDSSVLNSKDYSSKIVNCLGDSITYGYISSGNIANPTWVRGIANNIGCITNNYGVSATSICNGSNESFVTRLNNMTQSSIDVLLIFGGTNDYGDKRAHTLGTINDTPEQGTNFYASFKYLIEAAINKYPNAIIAVITPLRRSTFAANSYGISMEDIVTAEINVANYYGLPLLDMYHHGSINPAIQIMRTNYTADGLHPNQAGVNRFLIPILSNFTYSILKYL